MSKFDLSGSVLLSVVAFALGCLSMWYFGPMLHLQKWPDDALPLLLIIALLLARICYNFVIKYLAFKHFYSAVVLVETAVFGMLVAYAVAPTGTIASGHQMSMLRAIIWGVIACCITMSKIKTLRMLSA